MAKTEQGKETGEEREKKGRRRGKLEPAGARERASRFGALGGSQAVLPAAPHPAPGERPTDQFGVHKTRAPGAFASPLGLESLLD